MADAIAGFSGRIVSPAHPGYQTARVIWNRAHDRRPRIIAQCRNAGDVVAAPRHARERGLPVAVRAGGHNFAGAASVQDGMVIDLRGLDRITVDPKGGTARIGAGLTWGAVDPVLQRHGLATTGGSVSGVGVAGFTLGSGLGWLGRPHGLAGDNLLAAEIVTAAGEVITAAPDRHPDLYWALRGGTGNFGAVSAFTMRLFPLTDHRAARMSAISASGRIRPGWSVRSVPVSGTGWPPSSGPMTRTACSGRSLTRSLSGRSCLQAAH